MEWLIARGQVRCDMFLLVAMKESGQFYNTAQMDSVCVLEVRRSVTGNRMNNFIQLC